MATDDDVKEAIREILLDHVGKDNAIHAGDIADQVDVRDDDTHVRVREYLTELLEDGLPLASSTAHGYWIIENQDELDNYIGSLERRARRTENRKLDVLDAAEAWPELDLTDEEYI